MDTIDDMWTGLTKRVEALESRAAPAPDSTEGAVSMADAALRRLREAEGHVFLASVAPAPRPAPAELWCCTECVGVCTCKPTVKPRPAPAPGAVTREALATALRDTLDLLLLHCSRGDTIVGPHADSVDEILARLEKEEGT